jgi:hypothetical protein
MAEQAPNNRVRDILLDMARNWTRVALETEQKWRSAATCGHFQSSSASRLTAGASGFLNFNQSGDQPDP